MEFRLLRADEIECRVARVIKDKGVQLLLYKDARCDMNILDETVGPENWQRSHELINGNLFCNVSILTEHGWVTKQDVGTESNTEKEKGQASDSFKRACFNWGIGRELYTAPDILIWDASLITNGKCYENFTVEDIRYEGRRICYVKVVTEKGFYEFGKRPDPKIDGVKVNALEDRCIRNRVDLTRLLAWCKVAKTEDLTETQYSMINRRWDEVVKAYGRTD